MIIKKIFLTSAGIGVTAAVLASQRDDRRGGTSPASAGGLSFEKSKEQETSLSNKMVDALWRKYEGIRVVGSSFRRTWEQTDLSYYSCKEDSIMALLARFLISVVEEDISRNAMVAVGGKGRGHGSSNRSPQLSISLAKSKLSAWVIDRSIAYGGESEAFESICKYVAALFRDQRADNVTFEFLSHPKNATNLLKLAEASQDVRSAILSALVSAASEKRGSIADHGVQPASSEDLRHVVNASMLQAQSEEVVSIAVRMMLLWALSGVCSCRQLAHAGAGQAVGQIAGSAPSESVQNDCALLMTVLANETPTSALPMLRMDTWIFPALCFAADADASGNLDLFDASLRALRTTLRKGCSLPDNLLRDTTLPLFETLKSKYSGEKEIAARDRSDNVTNRRGTVSEHAHRVKWSVARTVQALAEATGVHLGLNDRVTLTEMILQWLIDDTTVKSTRSSKTTRIEDVLDGNAINTSAYVDALASLASPNGAEGIQIAYSWLSELISTLSHVVRPFTEIERSKENVRSDADGTWHFSSIFWPSKWHWPWSKHADEIPNSPLFEEVSITEHVEGVGVAEKMVEATAVDDEAKAMFEGRVPRSKLQIPSDSELSLYINAALIGPSYARSIASELLSSSGRLSNDVDVLQGDFTGMDAAYLSPTTMASYPAAATAVDLEMAEKTLCKALKVLCALASGEEKRRRWLLKTGVLRLIARVALEHQQDVESLISTLDEHQVESKDDANNGKMDSKRINRIKPSYPAQESHLSSVDMHNKSNANTSENLIQQENTAGRDHNEGAAIHTNKMTPFITGGDIFDRKTNSTVSAVELESALPLPVARQVTRLLALMSADISGADAMVSDVRWIPWLQERVQSKDCKISSCASRALLHIESAAAQLAKQRDRKGPRMTPGESLLRVVDCRLLPPRPRSRREDISDIIDAAINKIQHGIDSLEKGFSAIVDGTTRTKPLDNVSLPDESERLVLIDGIHLFDPTASHHETLAMEGVGATSQGAPVIDVVFVHGIRGGPFVTWRIDGVLRRGDAREHLDRSVCWPTAWLAPTIPEARLISAEYAAPASGWEGESLPLQQTADQLARKLVNAGVGHRPVVFVTHSMGGLVVKEILAIGRREDAPQAYKTLSDATTGVVFYSVPHAGSRLANWGWGLRYMGASPAHALAHLTPGPHLEVLNDEIRAMTKSKALRRTAEDAHEERCLRLTKKDSTSVDATSGGLSVLSFSEGRPTRLSYLTTTIVPHESAYPGYGDFVVLANHDHVTVCKPTDLNDPAFVELVKFLKAQISLANQSCMQSL